jgi:hypothetical protein
MDEQQVYDAFVVRHMLGLKSISDALKNLGLEELINRGHVCASRYLHWLKDVDSAEVDRQIQANYSKFYERYCRQSREKASRCDSSVSQHAPHVADSNCGGP